MKILFIGDIVGKAGRAAVYARLALLKKEYSIDFTIVNGENIAHGKGITEKLYNELVEKGVDAITLGNHAYSKADVLSFIDHSKSLIRPINMYPNEFGCGVRDFYVKGKTIRIINLIGSVFMDKVIESPFEAMKKLHKTNTDKIVIVDLHAEATSEKLAFAYQFKNECSAVIGTHTHVQTADEQLIDGCAFISDVGMCGSFKSIIGRDIDEVLEKFNGNSMTRFTVSENPAQVCAVVIDIDDKTLRATSIKRLQFRPESY
jgi:metallophosphoesterase (TIGR00282 family)